MCINMTEKFIPRVLINIKNEIYDTFGYSCHEIKINDESQEYEACEFKLNKSNIKFRTAKITPTKTGQFVTLWKRDEEGVTQPFAASDSIDFVVIVTEADKNFGHFVFPKRVLIDKGILSSPDKPGKRGFRVYSPWDSTSSKQAKSTQQWQLRYFLNMNEDERIIDFARAKMLYTTV